MKSRDIPPEALRWQYGDIDYNAIQPEALATNDALFHVIAGASFVESASDLYTANLIDFYPDDPALTRWLADEWQWQELQHGAALRRYVEHVWPDFDWPQAYADFFADYSRLCQVENFKASPALELAARCVVETGTASLYRMLHLATTEPVLKQLSQYIYSDEIHHYQAFRHFHRRYRQAEKIPRRRVVVALFKRLRETRNEDVFLAFKHAWRYRHPDVIFGDTEFRELVSQVKVMAKRHWPCRLSANMLLSPLDLPAPAHALTRWVVEGLGRLSLVR